MIWRVFCAVAGLGLLALSAAGAAYAFSPAMMLVQHPGFMASVAVIALLIALRLLWWAFAPASRFHRSGPRKRP